jgi:hypothetical protein
MTRSLTILIASLGMALAAAPQDGRGTIPAGTIIRVRTNEKIDSNNAAPGRTFLGIVADDALDRHGRVVIPRGSTAELAVTSVSKHQLTLDLASITANGRTFAVTSSSQTVNGTQKPGIGKNKRTAKFLGGGAAGGTIIGAIAGGGTGALIGGLVGTGAGAGAQALTRNKAPKVPEESLLSFRLEHPLIAR